MAANSKSTRRTAARRTVAGTTAAGNRSSENYANAWCSAIAELLFVLLPFIVIAVVLDQLNARLTAKRLVKGTA